MDIVEYTLNLLPESCQLCSIVAGLLGAFISAGVAIYVFNAGVQKEKKQKIIVEKQKLQDRTKYFLALILNLKETGLNQVMAIKEYVTELKKNEESDLGFKLISGFNVERLKQFDQSILFELLDSKVNKGDESSRNSINVIQQIDFLERVKEGLVDHFIEFSSKHQKYIEAYKNLTNEIVKFYENMGTDAETLGVKRGEDAFLEKIEMVIKEMVQEVGYQDYYKSIDLLVSKVEAACKEPDLARADHRVTRLLRLAIDAKFYWENALHLRNLEIELKEHDAKKIEDSLKEIDSNLKKLNLLE